MCNEQGNSFINWANGSDMKQGQTDNPRKQKNNNGSKQDDGL